jgi:hypothetical protein
MVEILGNRGQNVLARGLRFEPLQCWKSHIEARIAKGGIEPSARLFDVQDLRL